MSLSDENNCESLFEDDFIWEWQTNVNPWDSKETAEWTCYPYHKSSMIEKAYQSQLKEIILDENYRIDLKSFRQQNLNDSYRQRPIRRRRIAFSSSIISIEGDNEEKSYSSGRLSSPLGLASSCSATGDTKNYGTPFVNSWYMRITEGKKTITFERMFDLLFEGLIEEGQKKADDKLEEIIEALKEVQRRVHGKSSKKKIEELQICCAKLYTKHCFIYGSVNAALRDNDQTKLFTLGPFAYLLFNFIGRKFQNHSSIRDRFRRVIHQNEIQSINLYRGDRDFGNTVEQYRQAVGDNSKYFKWLQFVSTTRDEEVAKKFLGDILYIIQIQSYSSNQDQLTDMTSFSDYPEEKEILLLPGVRFQITEVKFDNQLGRHIISIQINSSYIYQLK